MGEGRETEAGVGGSESPEGTTRGDDGVSSTWTGARRDPDRIWEGQKGKRSRESLVQPSQMV